MMKRRTLLQLLSCAPLPVLASYSTAKAAENPEINTLKPNSLEDQSDAFSAVLARASEKNEEIFLPAGDYYLSNITLPNNTRLRGIEGATRLIYSGKGSFLRAENCEIIDITGIMFDGDGKKLNNEINALVDFNAVANLSLTSIVITKTIKDALNLTACSGFIEKSILSHANVGLYALDSMGLTISDNKVFDCNNGGILVHRSMKGSDKTIIRHNRIERIAAKLGGTGQYGNGINVFRAGDVMILNNFVANCAFSAIRCNSADNSHILGNTCHDLNEVAIYSEFSFEGTIIANNIVSNARIGISVANLNEGGRLASVTGNIIRNMHDMQTNLPYPEEGLGFGHGISIEAEAVVTGNVIENTAKIAIIIGYGPYMRNISVIGNIIRIANEGIGVSVVEGVGKAIIKDNIFDTMKTGSIFGRRWNEIVTKDMAKFGNQGFDTISLNEIAED